MGLFRDSAWTPDMKERLATLGFVPVAKHAGGVRQDDRP